MKKSVIKETYAKITLRKRHQDNENDQASPLTGAGELKRAKAVDNILNHTSEHDNNFNHATRSAFIFLTRKALNLVKMFSKNRK